MSIANLLICIQEADAAALDLYESGLLLEEAWENTGFMNKLTPLVGGLTFGFLGIEAFISQALPKCEAIFTTEHEFDKINTALDNFKTEKAKLKIVGNNVVLNGHTITGDLMAALDAYGNADYTQFGNTLGQITMDASQANDNNMYLY